MQFTIKGINHLGLAAKDPEKAKAFLGTLLGLSHLETEEVTEQRVLSTMFASRSNELDRGLEVSTKLEVLEGTTEDSPISQFVDKKGGGIHHLAFEVDRLEAAIQSLEARGVRFVDTSPRIGVNQSKVAFIHPHSTGGMLVELVELNSSHS